MAELEVRKKDGKAAGKVAISDKLATATPSMTTVHRTVVAEEANARQGTQKAKTRSEVRGGGRKPYKQKKTGNARQGSTRSPHYAHGAMALAVAPRDYAKKVNKRERRAAILGALSAHIEAGNVSVVDSIEFAEPKTKQAIDLLKAFGMENQPRLLVILPQFDEVAYKSFRNLGNVTVRTAPAKTVEGEGQTKSAAFSTRDLLIARKILVAKEALARIEEVWGK
jgi:large subunit ribosomal protein L4